MTNKIIAFALFGVGVLGYFANLDLWGIWVFAGFMVLTNND